MANLESKNEDWRDIDGGARNFDLTKVIVSGGGRNDSDGDTFITGGAYNKATKELGLDLNNGSQIKVPLDNLVTSIINDAKTQITNEIKQEIKNEIVNEVTADDKYLQSGTYDDSNKLIKLTLSNNESIDIPLSDLVSNLKTEILATTSNDDNYLTDMSIQDGKLTATLKDGSKKELDITALEANIYGEDGEILESRKVTTKSDLLKILGKNYAGVVLQATDGTAGCLYLRGSDGKGADIYANKDGLWIYDEVHGQDILRYSYQTKRFHFVDSSIRIGGKTTAGYVLTCDANGVGTWQESGKVKYHEEQLTGNHTWSTNKWADGLVLEREITLKKGKTIEFEGLASGTSDGTDPHALIKITLNGNDVDGCSAIQNGKRWSLACAGSHTATAEETIKLQLRIRGAKNVKIKAGVDWQGATLKTKIY